MLPRNVVESQPLKIFKTQLYTTLGNYLQLTMLEQGLEHLWKPPPILVILPFYETQGNVFHT